MAISMTLNMTTDILEDQSQFRDALRMGKRRKFLDQLRMLQHLGLIFYSELSDHEKLWSHAPFELTLDVVTKWPHLQSLPLDGFDSSAQEILYFLESHSSPLKALVLRNHFLVSGCWLQALPEMRESLPLEKAEIAGAVESNTELWLVRVPEFDKNWLLAEDLGYWLTHPEGRVGLSSDEEAGEEIECRLEPEVF